MTTRLFAQARQTTILNALVAFILLACSTALRAEAEVSETDLRTARAHWLAADAIAWAVPADTSVRLHYSAAATLRSGPGGIAGGMALDLAHDGVVDGSLATRFPHLAGLPLFRLHPDDLDRVPAILKSQFVVGATRGGELLAATALQPAGVLDDLFAFTGELGTTFAGGVPRFRLWAPTARSVTLLLFDDAIPSSAPVHALPMAFDAGSGTWSLNGDVDWNGKYFLFEVEVFVRRTGRIERNRVTDPYSLGLSTDSRRSLIVDLADSDLAPPGWTAVEKPALDAPEDIVL